MLNQVFTTKSHMSQTFIEGKRTPVTILNLPTQVVTQIKTTTKDGYQAVQVAIGQKNKAITKSQTHHFEASKLAKQPQWVQEIRFDDPDLQLKPGDALPVADILSTGDLVNVTGTTLGKGFAGVIKRHNFGGGPRTHGQSDRARAPGSIGRGTTPGRVLPGKKMPGHMGNITATIKNLTIIAIDQTNHQVSVSGPIPGATGQLICLTVTKKSQVQADQPAVEPTA